jgi:hypothetical protein
MPSENLKSDFAEDPASKAAFETLSRRFKLYMDAAGWGGKPLGNMMLSHMKLYYQWRFYKVNARIPGRPTRDQEQLRPFEPLWEKERNKQTRVTDSLRNEAKGHAAMAKALRESGAWMFGAGRAKYEEEMRLAARKDDEYLTQKAVLDTMPSSDGSFTRNVYIYDQQLLADARKLQALAKKKGREKLRPHYRAVLEAYEAEFERNQGLRNQELIAFFDTYVHDSLAGFAMDATLPSDPRVIYTGGDEKLRYAVNPPSGQPKPLSATG